MTDTTKRIFDKHEVRKTPDQRKLFRDYIISYAKSQGYEAKEERVGKCAYNVVVGNPKSASVIYTAHYDTCAVMPLPNFITPKNILIYLIYQVIMTTIIFTIPFIIMFGLAPRVYDKTGMYLLYITIMIVGYAALLLTFYLIMKGPANKHTANDNTSGVTLLADLMTDMPKEYKDKVAFVFFDLEELGMIGSKSFKKRYPHVAKKTPVVNFDCVSDGQNMLLVLKKHAAHLEPKLAEAFASNDRYTVEIATKGVFYPSDQAQFELGVGVAALNKTKRGLLYMNRIHTPRDKVYDEENIAFLKNASIELAKII